MSVTEVWAPLSLGVSLVLSWPQGDSGSNFPTLEGEPAAVRGSHLHRHHEVRSELSHSHV